MSDYSIFTDASFCHDNKIAFLGIVILNSNGEIIKRKQRRICNSSMVGEMESIVCALTLIPEHSNVTVFNDCLHAHKILLKNNKRNYIKSRNKFLKVKEKHNNIHIEYLIDNSNNWCREAHNIAWKSLRKFKKQRMNK